MKKKYTKEEKKEIALEGKEAKDLKVIADKYDVHFTTLYSWIRQLDDSNGRNYFISVKVSKEEKKLIQSKAKALGYEKDVSSYLRKIAFAKEILVGNPQEVREELYRTRGEINKIGSNINQIANYTNYLWKNKYVENSFSDELIKQTSALLEVCLDQKTVIDKSLRRIFN